MFLIDPVVQSSKLLFLKVNKFNRKLLDGFLFQSELSLFGARPPCHSALKIRKNCNLGKSHSLPQKLNSMVFEKISNGTTLKEEVQCGVNKKFHKTSNPAFEVISSNNNICYCTFFPFLEHHGLLPYTNLYMYIA